MGRHEYNDRLTSMQPEDLARRDQARRAFLAELETIDREALGSTDRVNYDMFRRQLALAVDDFRFKAHQIPINADSGFHTGFARLPHRVPLETTQDYENYVARLDASAEELDDERRAVIRDFLANDDGGEFFMVNLIRLEREPVADPKSGEKKPAPELL